MKEGAVNDEGIVVTFTKVRPEELIPGMLNLDVVLGIDVRGLELAPHPSTGKPSRPWGSLDNRLKGICKAAEQYAEGLVAMAQNPGAPLSYDED